MMNRVNTPKIDVRDRTFSADDLILLKERKDSPRRHDLRKRLENSSLLKRGTEPEVTHKEEQKPTCFGRITKWFGNCTPSPECATQVSNCFQRCLERQGQHGIQEHYQYFIIIPERY